MVVEPEVRVRYMKVFLQRIDGLPPADRSAIREAAPEWMIKLIQESGALGWLPGDINTELTVLVSRRLGPVRSHEFYKSTLINVFDSALLNTFIEGVLKLTGPDPIRSLKWVPRGMSMMFRNWGTWSTNVVHERSGIVEVRQLPEICRDSEGLWIESTRSALYSLYVRANLPEGSVRVDERNDTRGYVRYSFDWG